MGYRKTACRCRPFFYADGGTRTRMPEKGGGFSCCTMLPWPKDRCSLDYVLTMPEGLGRWYIVSTHFRKTCLARRCPCGISAELASIHAGGFPARCSNDLSPLCLPFHHISTQIIIPGAEQKSNHVIGQDNAAVHLCVLQRVLHDIEQRSGREGGIQVVQKTSHWNPGI